MGALLLQIGTGVAAFIAVISFLLAAYGETWRDFWQSMRYSSRGGVR